MSIEIGNVLSLFDGMSGARLALERAGIKINKYYASELDEYAMAVTNYRYPDTVQLGNVKEIKAEDLPDIDLLIGGSPCQDLSVAKKNREGLEGKRSGLFWEYVRLLGELNPKWFVLENVASMKKSDRNIITETLGVEPVMINSALVSAQNRKRLYWTNLTDIGQPEDKGILLKDVLQPFSDVDERMVVNGKSFTLTASYNGAVEWNSVQKKQRTMVKRLGHFNNGSQGDRVYSPDGKSTTISAGGDGSRGRRGMLVGISQQEVKQEVKEDKSTTIKAQYGKNSKANFERNDSLHATGVYCYPSDKPIKVGNVYPKGGQNGNVYSTEGKSKTLSAGSGIKGNGNGSNNSPKALVEKPVRVGQFNNGGQGDRIYSEDGKSVSLSANGGGTGSKTGLYAVASRGRHLDENGNRKDIKGAETNQRMETSYSEKMNTLTNVQKDSMVLDATQKDYIIRKLTPKECERLQTVPDDYTLVPHPKFKNRMMSKTQRYKMLGNGFTVDVIAHILKRIGESIGG